MTTSLKDRLSDDVKVALKAGRKEDVGALRLILAGIKQYEVDQRAEVDDTVFVDLLTKMAKQRRESISQFEAAGRDELVRREQHELELISAYLPQPLSDADVDAAIEAAIRDTNAAGMGDMGKVMGRLGGALKGRADMGAVSARVKSRLAG